MGGDPTYRTIPQGTTESEVKLYHMHIDPRFGQEDLDVVLPMRRLNELASEGVVGRPADTHYSYHGLPTAASSTRERNGSGHRPRDEGPGRRCGRLGPCLTLLLPVRGLAQRVLEAEGIPTVALSMIPEFTRAVGVPRLAGIAYPMSRPMGRPGDAHGQRDVLRALLDLLVSARAPDSYIELPYTWPETPAQARRAGTCPDSRRSHSSLPASHGYYPSSTPAKFRIHKT